MRIICIDFDGVIHSYSSGWKGIDTIPDPPVPGAIEWLRGLINSDDVTPVIYSSRSKSDLAITEMMAFLEENGLTEDEVRLLEFPTQKPPAFLTIDDRAICFKGTFPSIEEIKTFKPWNKN